MSTMVLWDVVAHSVGPSGSPALARRLHLYLRSYVWLNDWTYIGCAEYPALIALEHERQQGRGMDDDLANRSYLDPAL